MRPIEGMEEKNAESRKAGEIYCDSRETQQIQQRIHPRRRCRSHRTQQV